MEENISVKSVGIKYGLILSIISIAVFIVRVATETPEFGGVWLEILILVVGITLAHMEYKRKGSGFMSYGTGLGIGTIVAATSVVISSLFTYVYVKFINVDYIEQTRQMQIEAMEREGMSDDQIEMALKISEYLTPEILALIAILSTVFFGFILSLIISAFTKNDNPELSV
jgi:hypothetical protein